MLPPLASLTDFTNRLGRPVGSTEDAARAEAALVDASSIVRVEAGTTWMNDAGTALGAVPDAIATVVLAVARRVFDNPEGLINESLGSYAAGMANPTSDVYLKASERATIAKVVNPGGGIGTLSTTRGPLETPAVTDLWCEDLGIELEFE